MKLTEGDVEKRAEDALRACLEGVPSLQIKKIIPQLSEIVDRPDYIVEINSPEGRRILVLEVKRSGEPRIARQAVNQLLLYTKSLPDSYGVFLAPYVSPKAAEICAKAGIGYLDLSSNCRLCFGDIYIEREGRPNKFAEKRDLRSLYSPKATRVLRVLLAKPKKPWRIDKLAKEARISLGLAWYVKKLLGDREWILKGRNGFSLLQPLELLTEWSENYTFRKNDARDFYSFEVPTHVEAGLARICYSQNIRYGLTSFSAAARITPSVRYERVFSYVGSNLETIASQLNLKGVDSGANVTLLLPYDEGVFYGAQEFGGIKTVSAIQAYLDLKSHRGRGEEAARTILNEAIIPKW